MASLLLPESYTCNINGDDHSLEGFKVSEINGPLLTSFLEELQDEERDDERLNSVIQSLEAEINSSSNSATMDGHDSNMESSDRDCSGSTDDPEIGGRVDLDAVPCSPSEDMNWYMEPYGDEMHSIMNGYGGVLVNDYSHDVYNYGVALDLEEQGYSSLWQETTYDSVMYESSPQCSF